MLSFILVHRLPNLDPFLMFVQLIKGISLFFIWPRFFVVVVFVLFCFVFIFIYLFICYKEGIKASRIALC